MIGKAPTLTVLASGTEMGTLRQEQGRLSFCYRATWLTSPKNYPLSHSMPLQEAPYPDEIIAPFLWGLLPDNDLVLREWGSRFGTSHRNVFSLLSYVGEECAGAVQFASEERATVLTKGAQATTIDWLSEEELRNRIGELLQNPAAGRRSSDEGQFSLAGAQKKTALYFDASTSRWGVPRGHTPTTHIIKPVINGFEGHVENEHFCLTLASNLDQISAKSEVINLGGHKVLSVTRFDRRTINGRVERIHQEDFCQSAATFPHLKYQSDEGPGPREIVEILRESSTKSAVDVCRFIDALILNWFLCGTDAHAKNYGLLIAENDYRRLAPLYDIASALPYPRIMNPHKVRLAMKVGREYKIKKIGRRQWEETEAQLRVKKGSVIRQIEEMGEKMPVALEQTANQLQEKGISHSIVDQLVSLISKNVETCLDRLVME